MEEMIAEHRVTATGDDCYLLTQRIAESESLALEFTGELNEDSGAFRSMTCDIQVHYPEGTVKVGSLEFLELTQGGTLFQVYEMGGDASPEADRQSGSPAPTDPGLVRRIEGLVLSELREEGLLA